MYIITYYILLSGCSRQDMPFRSLSAYSKDTFRRNHISHDPRCRVAGPQTEVCILCTYLFSYRYIYLSINDPSPTRLISGRSRISPVSNQSINQSLNASSRDRGEGGRKARRLTGVPKPVTGSQPSVTGKPSVPHDELFPLVTSVKPR